MAKTFKTTRRKHDNAPVQKATCCIFCGAPQMTGEHIFSRWSHKFLPPRSMKKYDVERIDAQPTQSDRFLIKRMGDIRDWKVQSVCETNCNNGWMRSRVENLARPIMIPLIDRDRLLRGDTTRILPHQQKIIATWAALKAMVAEFDTHSWVTTHHAQRKYLMNKLTPPRHGWAIWIGAYLRVNWPTHWGSSPFLYLSPKQEALRTSLAATFYNSHTSTQVIGSLFIHVMRSPAADYIQNWSFSPPDGGSIFRIWPPSDVSISWPGKIMTDRDADYIATGLYNDLLQKVSPLIKEGVEKASTTRLGTTPFWRWRV